MVWDSNAYCSRGNYLSHNTILKVQTQGTTAKKPRMKESRPKEAKSINGKTIVLPYSNELAKPNCKKKRRKWLKKKKDSILIIRDNAIEGKKKWTLDDTSQVTCYNCQKKGHFTNKCSKPKN